jgi:hypothetical protein
MNYQRQLYQTRVKQTRETLFKTTAVEVRDWTHWILTRDRKIFKHYDELGAEVLEDIGGEWSMCSDYLCLLIRLIKVRLLSSYRHSAKGKLPFFWSHVKRFSPRPLRKILWQEAGRIFIYISKRKRKNLQLQIL